MLTRFVLDLEQKLITWPHQLILDQEAPHAYSQWEYKSTKTFSNGRVCVVGDAAHASTPWQGAGTGQAFEDAMILGTLLGATEEPSGLGRAFQAYDAVRRERCQRVIDSSRGTGLIFCGQDPGAGLNPGKIMEALAPRWGFIADIDLAGYNEEALGKMRAL